MLNPIGSRSVARFRPKATKELNLVDPGLNHTRPQLLFKSIFITLRYGVYPRVNQNSKFSIKVSRNDLEFKILQPPARADRRTPRPVYVELVGNQPGGLQHE